MVDGMSPTPADRLLAYAVAISAVVLVVRLVWTFTVAPLVDALPRSRIALSWRERLVLGWSGMRGGLSLGAALATPLSVAGAPVSHRDLLIFLTFSVLVVTLLLPGLTLPALVQRLGLGEADYSARIGAEARAEVARAALARLEDLSVAGTISPELVSQARAVYEGRLRRLEAELHGDEDGSADLDAYGRLRAELLDAERDALAHLRTDKVPDELVREIEHELDLEEARVLRHRGAQLALTNAVGGLPHFDPYPFIFMNLVFSALAADAAPFILLAETRQADRDRTRADGEERHHEELERRQEDLLEQDAAQTEQIARLLDQDTAQTEHLAKLLERVRLFLERESDQTAHRPPRGQDRRDGTVEPGAHARDSRAHSHPRAVQWPPPNHVRRGFRSYATCMRARAPVH